MVIQMIIMMMVMMMIIKIIFTVIGLSPGGSGYFLVYKI